MAFYDDLADRQELPFPRRFLPTFRKEFTERVRIPHRRSPVLSSPTAAGLRPPEHLARGLALVPHGGATQLWRATMSPPAAQEFNSLVERTLRKHGSTLSCRCLVAIDSAGEVGGCLVRRCLPYRCPTSASALPVPYLSVDRHPRLFNSCMFEFRP